MLDKQLSIINWCRWIIKTGGFFPTNNYENTLLLTFLWLVWLLVHHCRTGRGLFDPARSPTQRGKKITEEKKEKSKCLSTSKQPTFTFLQSPDTLTPLSHPRHELYIICARENSTSPILVWNVGASCLAGLDKERVCGTRSWVEASCLLLVKNKLKE